MLDLHQHAGSGVYRASTGLSDSLPSWCPGRFVLLSSEILATGRALHVLAPKPAPGAGSRGSSFVSPFTPPYGEGQHRGRCGSALSFPSSCSELCGDSWPPQTHTAGLGVAKAQVHTSASAKPSTSHPWQFSQLTS